MERKEDWRAALKQRLCETAEAGTHSGRQDEGEEYGSQPVVFEDPDTEAPEVYNDDGQSPYAR